jgi:hypothetical protein
MKSRENRECEQSVESVVLTHESASAELSVDHSKKHVHIADIYAAQKRSGDGSALLQKIKQAYPDYVIAGNAIPTELLKKSIDEPTDEEVEWVYNMGWDFQKGELIEDERYFPVLSPEEKIKVRRIGSRLSEQREDPYLRLLSFYKKNGFEIDMETGQVISRPPHR